MSSSDDSDAGGCQPSLDLPLRSVERDLEVQGHAASSSATDLQPPGLPGEPQEGTSGV